jgi:hypothetical protein
LNFFADFGVAAGGNNEELFEGARTTLLRRVSTTPQDAARLPRRGTYAKKN